VSITLAFLDLRIRSCNPRSRAARIGSCEGNVKNSAPGLATLSAVAILASCEMQPPGAQSEGADLTGSTITLYSGSGTQSGYDFHAQTYHGNSGGDFYFTGGAFWANNAGQRGVVDVGASCPALTVSAMPASGYGSNVLAVAGHCYVALTRSDTRDFVVFQVSTASSASVTLVWTLVTSGDSGVTLTNMMQGFDFSSKTYVDGSVGDFYFLSGSLWANNLDQRGVVALGACPSVESAPAPPATGYNRNGVALSTGICYAAIMRYDSRHRIVFRADSAGTSSATLTWRLMPVPLNQLAWQHCDPYTPVALNNTGVPANILASWLQQHPTIENAMQWMQPVVGTTPTTVGYTSWPANLQTMLSTNFVAYWNWYNSGMTGADPSPPNDPPANTASRDPIAYMAVSAADAQTLYVKYVALTLVVEIQGRVPWTITSYDSASLAELLDARKFFTEYTSAGYGLMPETVVPAPPLVTAQFVAQNNFLCANRPATIAEAVFWARNLEHYYNVNLTNDELIFWQYAGAPPASRVLAGTKYTGTASVSTDLHHWTLGCHGTTGLLKMLLRALNIPVEHFSFENTSVTLPQDAFLASLHAVPHFLADRLWLSHGDDPYFISGWPNYNGQLPFPLQAMLVSDAQFLAWFPNPGTWTSSSPLGQQQDEIWIHYGDISMLYYRIQDLQTTPPTDQNICSWITVSPANNVYTCAQAEQMGLLSMLDPLLQPYLTGQLVTDAEAVPRYYPPLPQTMGLLNPSFIDGSSGWTTVGTATMGTSGCYGDTSCLVLGATTPTNGDSTAYQTFTAPPGSTGISLWFKETCPDSLTFDWATITLTDLSANGAVTTLLANTCTTNGWTRLTAAVTAGHNYTLTLTSHDDDWPTDPTYTLLDNVVFTNAATPASGIINGGFEAGLSGWTASGASVGPVAGGYVGATALQLGGTAPTSGDSSASQSFVVPSATPNLSFWYKMTCPDTVTYDWIVVTLVDNTTGVTSTLVPQACVTTAWTQVNALLTAGHSYTLTLTSHDDAYPADPSYTLFDAVSLN
jgi:hypothetical protein